MRTRMYGGVRGRKTKVGGKPTFVFLLLDFLLCLKGMFVVPLNARSVVYVYRLISYAGCLFLKMSNFCP